MNGMIERYIYDVTRRLPEKERNEVNRELDESITDMLPDNPNEQDIIDVLTKLGAPNLLAEQYRQKPRYLISPSMFELYISVLKTVVLIVASVCACIEALMVVSSGVIIVIIRTAIIAAIDGALQAALWVTLGFALAEHYGQKHKPWKVSDLPHLPNQKGVKISRSSSIIEMVVSIFFTAFFIIMIVRNESFFIFVSSSDIIKPFTQTALDRCIPYLILLSCFALVINGLKLYWARWNLPLCIANIVYNVVWVSIVLYMLHWPDFFSYEFISITNMLTGDVDIFRGGVVILFSAVFVIIAAIDMIASVWKTWKGMRETAQ